jgi:4-diphosphocytidyl-2-C-methyl-D-erythritol kinase
MKTVVYREKCPAKLNLGLHVLSKRKDGFHNIETIFYPVNLFDYVTVKIAPSNEKRNRLDIKINSNIDKISDKDNICYEAVRLYFRQFKIDGACKVQITIRKKIPIGAGLGGGSSNAASVLSVLAKHFKARDELKLRRIALSLGSDVPFFLNSRTAYAESRGEKLTRLPKFKIKHKILIVYPNIHVSTKWAYESLNVKNQSAQGGSKIKPLKRIKRFDIMQRNVFSNDFEKVVFEKYPEIKSVKDKMYECGAVFSSLSGSGSAVYGLFADKSIKQAGKYFKSKGCGVYRV